MPCARISIHARSPGGTSRVPYRPLGEGQGEAARRKGIDPPFTQKAERQPQSTASPVKGAVKEALGAYRDAVDAAFKAVGWRHLGALLVAASETGLAGLAVECAGCLMKGMTPRSVWSTAVAAKRAGELGEPGRLEGGA